MKISPLPNAAHNVILFFIYKWVAFNKVAEVVDAQDLNVKLIWKGVRYKCQI